MLEKLLEESNIDISLALSWWINTKNSLAKAHVFPPFQLALGQNPKLPSIFIDKTPAYIHTNTRKILTDNLTALQEQEKFS